MSMSLIVVLIHQAAGSYVPCMVSRLLERNALDSEDKGLETIKAVGATAFAGQPYV
jgi:hypothetical protein